LCVNTNGLGTVTYPIAFKNVPFTAITSEGDPTGWDNNTNGVVISGANLQTASNTRMNVVSKWVLNGGTVIRATQSSVRLILIGV
jgi:hypothetical protein